MVIATNAPLLPHQLKRVAKRAALGVARTGASVPNSSGDLFIAFSRQANRLSASLQPDKTSDQEIGRSQLSASSSGAVMTGIGPTFAFF